ncbi:Uncharacterised protein [Mycobacteroides abscessus]|nr:Uncharacterised protein [Mycobacteroides abscessus]SKT38627.1 Uncharacterised protein [Mycobacteroides abscessus subsp. abscessus]
MVPRTREIVLSSLDSGKTRYSSRAVTFEVVGEPMTSALPEKLSVWTVEYW